ncbi:MAG: hypothetical protein ACLFPF_08665 [Halanaerobiales bacterium]
MSRQSTNISKFKIIMLVTLTVLFFSSYVGAIGVRPLIIDLDAVPGETKTFEITLTPSEDDEIVNINYYQPIQMETGDLSYQEADSQSFPAINWIELEQNRVELPADENRKVKGTVTVPFGADSSYTAILMVEPEVEEAEQGVTFKVRYAIRLNINIQSPGMRPRGEITSFEFDTESGEQPIINTIFHNTSKMHYDTSAEATIRNEQGRLLQRLQLKTPAAWQSGRESTTVYPGAEVLYTGTVTEPLYPGNYEIGIFYRYADGMQIIERQEITVEGNLGSEEELKPIRLSPENISMNIRAGSSDNQVIEIENYGEAPISLNVSGRDIVRDYSHSLYKAVKIQLRGAENLTILPGSKKRVVLSVNAPQDIESAGYYGYIDFVHQISEEEKEVYTNPVDVIVGQEEFEPGIEILSLHYDGEGEEGIYSVETANQGDIHITPEGELTIKDSSGEIVTEIDLGLQEGVNRILPDRSALLIAVAEKLNSGTYTAEVNIDENGQEIAEKEFEIKID